jgi:hypothetical protein
MLTNKEKLYSQIDRFGYEPANDLCIQIFNKELNELNNDEIEQIRWKMYNISWMDNNEMNAYEFEKFYDHNHDLYSELEHDRYPYK